MCKLTKRNQTRGFKVRCSGSLALWPPRKNSNLVITPFLWRELTKAQSVIFLFNETLQYSLGVTMATFFGAHCWLVSSAAVFGMSLNTVPVVWHPNKRLLTRSIELHYITNQPFGHFQFFACQIHKMYDLLFSMLYWRQLNYLMYYWRITLFDKKAFFLDTKHWAK